MKTNVNVDFSILSDDYSFKPDIITKRLNLQPKEFWIKGDPIKNRGVRLESCWYIETGYCESLDISNQLNLILDILMDKREILKELKEEFNFSYLFMIVLKIVDERTPAIIFDPLIIEFANYIGATIEIDSYVSFSS